MRLICYSDVVRNSSQIQAEHPLIGCKSLFRMKCLNFVLRKGRHACRYRCKDRKKVIQPFNKRFVGVQCACNWRKDKQQMCHWRFQKRGKALDSQIPTWKCSLPMKDDVDLDTWDDDYKIPEGLSCNKYQRISMGQLTSIESWKWLAHLKLNGKLCGGSILNQNTIVTAGHCCEGSSIGKVQITIGSTWTHIEEENEQSVIATQLIIHPNFDKQTFNNDICIIKTKAWFLSSFL